MPAAQVRPEVQAKTRERLSCIVGGAAGDHTVTGIKLGDELINVLNVTVGGDLVEEFTITAADTINNAGGTSTVAENLLVRYYSQPAGGI